MPTARHARRDFFLIMLASISWGTVGVANRQLYHLGPTNALSLSFLRLAIGAPVFVAASWVLLKENFFAIRRRDLGIMVLMGCLIAVSQALYIAAIGMVGVSVSTLIAICAAPVVTGLLSVLILHERLTLATIGALIAAVSGTALLVFTPSQPALEAGQSHLGVFVAFLSAACYAGFIFCGRLLTTSYHPIQISTVAFVSGALLLLVCAAPTGLVLRYTPDGWLILIFLGLVPTALGYGLFQVGIRSHSATVAAIVTMFEPLTAALLAWLMFGERLGLVGLLGALLLLAAMALIVLLPQQYFESGFSENPMP